MSKLYPLILAFLLFAIAVNGGPTKEQNHRKRGPKDLSDEEHYDPNTKEHNPEYDHEAFLGKDEAEEIQKMSPAEQRRRLKWVTNQSDNKW